MGPFDLPAADFIGLYSIVILVGLVLAVLLRWLLRAPGGTAPAALDLHPYEVAHLAGGPTLAIHAAVARLLQGGQLTVGESTGKVFREAELPPDALPLERQLHEAATGRTTVYNANDKVSSATEELAGHLQERGLELSTQQAARAVWVPAGLLIAVALFGLFKLAIDRANDHGFDELLLLAILVPVAGVALALFAPPRRTRRGDGLLHQLREQHAALAETAGKQPEALPPAELTLAVALFGVGVLTTGPLSKLRRAVQSPPSTADAGEVELPPPPQPPPGGAD
jgi:uncharacterized protein (TIGR04222 family)